MAVVDGGVGWVQGALVPKLLLRRKLGQIWAVSPGSAGVGRWKKGGWGKPQGTARPESRCDTVEEIVF